MSTCARQCWIFAAVMGVVVFALSVAGGGVGAMPGLFLGAVTTGLLGGLLIIMFCQGADDVKEWPRTVDNAKDPDAPGAPSIRRDGAPVAQVPVARPQRPQGMEGAPQGASGDPAQAVTFTVDAGAAKAPADVGVSETTDAGRLAKPRRGKGKAAPLADAPETAHSGSTGRGEST